MKHLFSIPTRLRTVALAASLVPLFLPAPRAAAAAFTGSASESFDYAAGPLVGQNGGAGFAGPWAAPTTGTFVAPTVTGANLSDSLPTAHALFTGSGTSGTTGVASAAFRPLPTTVDSGTVYIGFNLERNTDSQRTLVLGLYLGQTSGTNERLAIGQVGFISSGAQTGTAGNIGLLFGNSTAAANRLATGVSMDTDSAFRLVLRIDYNPAGNDTVRLYINPTLNAEPEIANLTTTAFEVGSFNNLRPFAGGSSGSFDAASGSFDDLRVGASYLSVVPEPSTAGSIVLGSLLLGVVLYRRSASAQHGIRLA